jgi:hypothetical protein
MAGVSAGALADLWRPSGPFWYTLPGTVLRALGFAAGVWLAGRLVPRGNRWVALGAALVVATLGIWHVVNLAAQGTGADLRRDFIDTAALVAVSALVGWLGFRRPKSGFARRRTWFAVTGVLTALAVAVGDVALTESTEDVRRAERLLAKAPDRVFQDDGMSFRYPAIWKLDVGDWQPLKGDRGSKRRLVLQRDRGEAVYIREYRPATVLSDEADFPSGLLFDGKPTGNRIDVSAAIGGRSVLGYRRDMTIRYLTFHAPFRYECYSFSTKKRTVLLIVSGLTEHWSEAEPRFRSFFEHFEAD